MSKEVPQPIPKMDKKALMENMEDKNIYEGREPELTHYSDKPAHKSRSIANRLKKRGLTSAELGNWVMAMAEVCGSKWQAQLEDIWKKSQEKK